MNFDDPDDDSDGGPQDVPSREALPLGPAPESTPANPLSENESVSANDPLSLNDPVSANDGETNPYAIPESSVPVAELVEPDAGQSQTLHPRWWTPLAITGVSLFLCLIISSVMLVVAMIWVDGEFDPKLLLKPDYLVSLMESRVGFCCIVIPPQLMLLIPSFVAAFLSPVPTGRRLSLVRGHWPIWAWLGAAAAAPLVGLISSLVLSRFMTQSESLEMMSDVFLNHCNSGFLIPLALIIGMTPAICEEILFRGYVQTRLNRSFGPAIGIFIASFLFAAFHMDWVHSIAVFPLGVFLGVIVWRSGSIFPAMLAHFVNNVISVLGVAFGPQTDVDVLDLPTKMVTSAILIAGIIGVAAVMWASVHYGKPTQPRL